MDLNRAYEILEIDETASFSEIKQAYRDLASIWHPDRHSNNSRLAEKALHKMKEINAAYDLLSTWHTEIDRSKSRESHEEVIVKCHRCGAQNRIRNISGVSFKCGKCHHSLFDEHTSSDNSERILCGDGECIGVIRNGRCTVCGKTLEEGIKADDIKTIFFQNEYAKRQEKDTKQRKIKKFVKYTIVSTLIILIIYALYIDEQNTKYNESKHTSSPTNNYEVNNPFINDKQSISSYRASESEFKNYSYNSNDIKQLQAKLKLLGYDIGLVDGNLGPMTIEACNKFIIDFRVFSKINSIKSLVDSLKTQCNVTEVYSEWPNIVRNNILANWVMKQKADFRTQIIYALKSNNSKNIIVVLRFYTFDMEKPSEQALPKDGVYWQAFENGIAPLKISTRDRGQSHFIKIVDSKTNKEVLKAFLRGGHTVEFDVPLGNYIIKYAVGGKWYGEQFLFGPYTAFGKVDKVLEFKQIGYQVSGYSIELYLQPHGNLHTSALTAFQF